MSYACPKCSSENTQQLALIHGAGTSSVTARGTAVGIDLHGDVGVGAISTTGTSQSVLAQRYAPPKKMDVNGQVGCVSVLALIVGVSAWIGTQSFVGFLAAIIPAGLIVGFIQNGAKKYNATTYRTAYDAWRKKFACLRCGNVFERRDDPAPMRAVSTYTVVLAAPGDLKIRVIKEVREITGRGLAEAKLLVESVPSTLATHLSASEAAAIQTRLEIIGAFVDVNADP